MRPIFPGAGAAAEPESGVQPRPPDGGFSGSFSLDADASVGADLADRIGGWPQREENWRRSVAWRGALVESGLFRLEFEGGFDDARRPAEADDAPFAVGPVVAWEENTVGAAGASLGLFGGRVELTTRHAVSRYIPPPSGFHSGGKKKKEWKEDRRRFAGVDLAQGRAALYRLDATLWQDGDRSLSAFGQYTSVDGLFEDLELAGDDEHPFAEPDRRALEAGGAAAFGPAALKLWYGRERNDVDERTGRPTTLGRRGHWHATLALDDRRLLGPAEARGDFGRLLPDSVWFDGDRGRVELLGDSGPTATADRASSLGAGLAWSRGAFYAGLEMRRKRLDSRQSADADTEERTMSLGFGYYGDRWGMDAGLDLERYSYKEVAGTATDRGYGIWAAASLRPDRLPDITGNFNFYRYEADYVADGTNGRYDGWKLEAGFDFSKFLADETGTASPRLVARYQLDGADDRDPYSGATTRVDQLFVVSVSYPLP